MAVELKYKCPVCGKQYMETLEAARHIFGTGDKKHVQWVNAQGSDFKDLLVQQAMQPGNASYQALPT